MKRIIVGVGLALLLAGGCQRGEDQYQFPPEDHGPGGEVVEGADSVEGDLVAEVGAEVVDMAEEAGPEDLWVEEAQHDAGCLEDCAAHECGNGVCDENEDPCNCAEDCLEGQGFPGEACCAQDDCAQPQCGPCCVVECVDFVCSEDIWKDDCCGNGVCEIAEDHENCPEDCGVEMCGNGTCNEGETPCNCPADCQSGQGFPGEPCCAKEDCAQPLCGPCCVVECQDFECSEDIWLDDCCWNDKCEADETFENCPMDCTVESCGNGICDGTESADSCPHDCLGKCMEEGDWEYFGDDLQCCGELTLLAISEAVFLDECAPLDCGIYFMCTACGDGECGVGENFCTCPADCKDSCVQQDGVMMGDTGCCEGNPFVKALKLGGEGCDLYVCALCGDGECGYGETADNCPADCGDSDCVAEGLPLGNVENVCCPGSTILNSNWIPDAGACAGTYCYDPVCANCGDGECGKGENYCSCPDDCGDLTCLHEGGLAMTEGGVTDCCDGLTPKTYDEIEGCGQYTCLE